MVINKEYLIFNKGETFNLKKFGAPNFDISEFHCKCKKKFCYYNFIDLELLKVLHRVRKKFKNEVRINSAFRCGYHNNSIRTSASRSRHMAGHAADISVIGFDPVDVYNYINIELNHNGGLGLYNTFVHVDVRGDDVRWDNRS